jgi:Putative peptidoglycan binding domain
MKRNYASEHHALGFIVIFALAVGTFTGWGTWFLSGQRADRIEQELRTLVSTLTQRQVELLHERTQAQTAKMDLVNLQAQAASLRQEITGLTQRRNKAQAETAANRYEAEGPLPSKRHTSDAEVESTTVAVDQRKANITLAQKELTRLGYGSLRADGIMGPSTKSALEAFQYKNSLKVTKELDASTMRRLTGSTAMAASE